MLFLILPNRCIMQKVVRLPIIVAFCNDRPTGDGRQPLYGHAEDDLSATRLTL
jgi:hypothetical protein